MRMAIISDVHANLEALTAIIRDIEKQNVEKVHFLGDVVGYGDDPDRCIALIDDLCDIKLLGNHDYVALGLESPTHFNSAARESIIWTQEKLQPERIKDLADFEMEATCAGYRMVHATPEHPSEWNYLLSVPEAKRNFEFFTEDFCFVGHSHIPAVFCRRPDGEVELCDLEGVTAEPDCRYIINVGSVGQPRDGNPHACYLVADTIRNNFAHRRVPYDVETAQDKMKKAQLPNYLITRLASGR
jgi:diadenosine tetraphosphatase ApaH/serine/threonine PP2A family protein phosphatase